MQRLLIFIGAAIVLVGLTWPWVSKLPLGHLPGDFQIDRPGMKFYFPLTTCLLVSGVISLIAWLLRK